MRWGRPSWVTLVVLVAVVGLVVFAAGRVMAWQDAKGELQDRRDAVASARDEVQALTTISADSSDADIDRLLDGATESFRAEFEQQADSFRQALRRGKVTSTGDVVSAGVLEIDADSASVVVAATGSVKNSRSKKPEPRSYRLRVDLERVDEKWLVSGLEFVA